MSERASILLVDDHEVVRQGLRMLLENLLRARVVEAGTAEEALDLIPTESLDLVLLDARMAGRGGIWALQQIRESRPDLPVIMLSNHDTEEDLEGALEAGAAGYLPKDAGKDQLLEAVDTALSGRGVYLDPSAAERVLDRSRRSEGLSERELQVLELLAEGATNETIAAKLYLSEKTVKSHLSNIFRKLEVKNRTQAAAKAIRERLVEPS